MMVLLPEMETRWPMAGVFFTLRDRKSTRLNSSHSQISYAVFCLKKKKDHNLIHLTLLSHLCERSLGRTNSMLWSSNNQLFNNYITLLGILLASTVINTSSCTVSR